MEWKEDASVEVTFKDCIECKGTGVVWIFGGADTVLEDTGPTHRNDPQKCSICEGKGTVFIKEERNAAH